MMCVSVMEEAQGDSSWSVGGKLRERRGRSSGKGGFALAESYVVKKIK